MVVAGGCRWKWWYWKLGGGRCGGDGGFWVWMEVVVLGLRGLVVVEGVAMVEGYGGRNHETSILTALPQAY